jgi:hypothetical protein
MMSRAKIGVLLTVFSGAAACGSQIVEFKSDGGPDKGMDASFDATSEADTDSHADQEADGRSDASGDGALDQETDAGPDATTDAAGDAGSDARTDAAGDAGGDASTDAAGDGAADAQIERAPVIISTTPTNGALGVSVNERPSATFDQPMNPASITALTFTLMQGATPISGVVTYDPTTNTATFTPDSPLSLNLVYTATVTSGVSSLGGRSLPTNDGWTFTTAACSQAPVALGSAANFVVLAGSTVTNTGATMLTGDMGVGPGTAITGFPPGTIVGTEHAGDAVSAQGIADLTTAYLDAAGRVLCPVSVSGDIGGQTLAPGLYTSTSGLAVTTANLTLDGQGDGNAVFIFQTASTLTTASGRQVILINGAQSANVFWQVGSSATLATTSVFQGTIMAHQAITLDTGATLNGRALAEIAGVALDTNTIVKPTP